MNLRQAAILVPLAAIALAGCGSANTDPSPAAASAASARASQSSVAAVQSKIAKEVASQAAAASPTPAAATRVEFVVTGSAPDGIDITYGPSGSNFGGPSVLNGTARMSVPFRADDNFYALSAQLQGAGSIRCKIVVTGPGDDPLTVSHGAASGGYNICSAQATSDDGGFTWQDEN
jgi:hypothetical protein